MIALLAALPLLASSVPLTQNPPAGQGTSAQGTAGTQGGKVPPIQEVGDFYVLTFDETDDQEGMKLDQFVKICQEVTGINFTYTKDTAGVLKNSPLRMFGPKRIPKSDFYSFFQIMMIINDFVCIKIGPDHLSVVLIQSLQAGGRTGGPQVRNDATYVQPEDIERFADQPATLITTVIDLPNTDVRTLSNSMRTMFTDANTQQIIPVGANSLIITGFGSNVASIVRMLHFVDAASKTTVEPPEFDIIKLEFAAADDIASLVEELLDASKRALQGRAGANPNAGQGVTAPLQQGQGETKIMTDPRTNSLIVMAMREDMPRIKELVARLDVDEPQTERTYHIYSLENVAAEDLAKTLDDFIKDAQRVAPTGPGNVTGNRPGGAAASSTSSGRNEIVVVADKVTNSLLIAANRTRFDEVRELIKRLDHRQDQVLIETALIELSGQDSLNLAVELGGANLPGSFGVTSFGLSTFQDTNNDGVPDVRVPNISGDGAPPQGITAGILRGSEFNLPILLGALKGRRDSNVLNIPSVLVNNNGSAKVVSKDEQPTTQVTATGGVGGQTQENFRDYVNAGITMQISPTISASRYLRLKVSLEVSNFTGQVSGAIPPPKTTRTIDTTVNVPDGDTMVIGGIVTDNKTKSRSGVPWVDDIPILGFLFRSDSDTAQRTTLYFFVTPHILRDKDFADLAEVSYKKKLEAADTIGVDRIRVIDPRFGKDEKGIDLRGFEVPLYRSPARGEVDANSVGIDPARLREMTREAAEKQKAADTQNGKD
ncbi:MAG: secretin N-terminal domain-containing protein [Planctomycetota bacterium]